MNPAEAVNWIFNAWRQTKTLIAEARVDTTCGAVNDCGCFVLMFAQLESAINAAYESHVGGSWEDVSFLHRVNMLNGLWIQDNDLALIIKDYEIRCKIAHGRALESPKTFLSSVAEEYEKIIEQLA
jgi:hypothetical protein